MAVTQVPEQAAAVEMVITVRTLRARLRQLPPVLLALVAQLLAAIVAVPLMESDALALPGWGAHGLLAAAAGGLLGLPAWWLPINAGFVPAALWLDSAGLGAQWFLGAFTGMAALFWTTYRSRVPLYLSSPQACDALARLLPEERQFRFVDLGCGFGGVLRALSRRFPNGRFSGLEIAPLPAWIAWLRAARGGFHATQGDFWKLDLGGFDVIYAYLSPQPMEALWEKAAREARSGALLVSNSFVVPGVEPHEQVPLGAGARALYVWRF